jgi:hypothetical protein
MNLFAPKNDVALREGIRSFYCKLIAQRPIQEPVVIHLPTDAWISANGLNMLLTFVEAIQFHDPDARIFVDLIDYDRAQQPPAGPAAVPDDNNSVIRKLVFYEAMQLIQLLQDRRVVTRPSWEALRDLQDKLGAHKQPSHFLHSTRMLSLSPLVETDEEQFALTTRMRTFTGILYKHLFGRLDLQSMLEASNQIMFELVKNIYQHSELPDTYASKSRGFACAQVNQYPLIRSDRHPHELVTAVLEQVRPATRNKKWQWLTVTVSDFGVGISNKVSRFLRERSSGGAHLKAGRFSISDDTLLDHATLIQIAATTDFSTKLVHVAKDYAWVVQGEEYPLAGRGYGLVYCIGFIARMGGRMRVRSGPAEVDILPRPELILQQDVWSNVERSAEALRQDLPPFDVVTRSLPPDQAMFPGTQIVLEIPVEDWRS